MPHLSPMNWILMILSIWILLLSLMSITYSKYPMLYSSPKSLVKSSLTTHWSWQLQDGRDMNNKL